MRVNSHLLRFANRPMRRSRSVRTSGMLNEVEFDGFTREDWRLAETDLRGADPSAPREFEAPIRGPQRTSAGGLRTQTRVRRHVQARRRLGEASDVDVVVSCAAGALTGEDASKMRQCWVKRTRRGHHFMQLGRDDLPHAAADKHPARASIDPTAAVPSRVPSRRSRAPSTITTIA